MDWLRDFVAALYGAVSALLVALGIDPAVLFASGVGGYISLHLFEDDESETPTKRRRFMIVFGGAAIGTYCSALIMAGLDLPERNVRIASGLGLMLALFGMSLAAACAKAVRGMDLREVIESWIKRK